VAELREDLGQHGGDTGELKVVANMSKNRERFAKIVAIAMDPAAFEDEAIAALRKARQLVREDPSLKQPGVHRPRVEPSQTTIKARITSLHPDWLNILLNSLSQQAYGLGLRSKITCDFSVTPWAVEAQCDGSEEACNKFLAHVDWVVEYINKQVAADRVRKTWVSAFVRSQARRPFR
jgi:hypothetical protein